MKKITAFFMAIMPFFVVVLLFVAGMIVKDSTHVYVSSVEIVESETGVAVDKKTDESKPTTQLHANVLPLNATNPKIRWVPSDDKIIEVDANGLVTCKDWGEAYVYAVSDENQTLTAACKVDVKDNVIHAVNVTNKDIVNYVGIDQTQKINIETKPSISHIDDPIIQYKALKPGTTEESGVCRVTDDGLIIPMEKGDATIEITPKSNPDKVTTVNVTVGTGVDTIALINPAKEVISEVHYDLFEQIKVAPETDTSKIKATDFIYTADKEDATIDTAGHIQFFNPSTVTFTAKYKRNQNLFVNKTIQCTSNKLDHVYFSQPKVEVNFENDQTQTIDTELNWYVYPFKGDSTTTEKASGVTIISSNENVIQVVESNGAPSLRVKGVGDAVLTAMVNTSSDSKAVDTCLVNVKLPESGFVKQNSISIDSAYYALRNNVKLPSNKQFKDQEIEFETSNEDDTYIDQDEILHFNKPGVETEITVTVGEKEEKFKITSNPTLITKTVNDKVNIEVGQLIKFNDGWYPDFEEYKDFFDIVDQYTFIAKSGRNIEKFNVTNGSETRTINLIVKEKPIYIASETGPYYSTPETTIDVKNMVVPSIFPSTATMSDGSKYGLSYQYYAVGDKGKTSVENDVITYNDIATVACSVSCVGEQEEQTLWQEYLLSSTYGDKLGRFAITDGKTFDPHTYSQYETITVTPGTPVKLYCSEVTSSLYDDINITSKNGLVDTGKAWTGILFDKYIEFTISATGLNYGEDVVTISTKAYTLHLNIKVNAEVTDLVVTRESKELAEGETNSNKTYTQNLWLKATATPCTVESPTIEATFNGTDVKLKQNIYIDLSDESLTWNAGEDNTLVVTCGSVKKTYKFNNLTGSTPVVSIEGTENNELYLGCNYTQKVCTFVTDGFVDDDWYKNNITIGFKEDKGEKHSITSKYLTLHSIPVPQAEEEAYSNELYLKVNGETKQTYTLGRDLVSRIILPKHDNDDLSDKKGLQKVHVYGDRSFFKDDNKVVDYYKLPVQLYDFNHNLIKNTKEHPDLVYRALKTLKASFGGKDSTYKLNEDGFIEIHFAKNDLYTFEELRDNAFDAKQSKNVTFSLSTKSNEAKASYTFVATEGVNQYCQEGIKALEDDKVGTRYQVLQTNFGLGEEVKENVPLTTYIDKYWFVYGNGYTVNNDATMKSEWAAGRDFCITVIRSLNTTFVGANKQTLRADKVATFDVDTGVYQGLRELKYTSIENFVRNTNFAIDNGNIHFNKCLFKGNLLGTLYGVNGDKNETLIEDCIFFDAGGFPILSFNSKIKLKGFMDVYNFHNKEILRNIPSPEGTGTIDLSIFWPIVENAAKKWDMVSVGADGKNYINSSMCIAYSEIMFYVGQDEKGQDIYQQGSRGNPLAARFAAEYINVGIPGKKMSANLWASVGKLIDPLAPDYYSEFDKNGNLRLDLLWQQIDKISRQINYF